MSRLWTPALFGAASTIALAAALPASAQAPQADAAGGVQEIVVTAQKREQKLIDVPITLTAYTGEQLARLGVQDLHDLSLHTPGFYVQNQSVNDPGIVMRGVTTDSTDPTDEPRVSIFQDGVSISQIPAAAVELFDLERVEVAKGPQTTLYGRSALTGAVNIIENKATEKDFDWSLHAEGGNYNDYLFEGMVNAPINDVFAIRVAAIDKARDGYIKNLAGGDALNGVSTKAIRVSANYHPSDRLNDDLLFNYEYDDPSGTDFKNKTFLPSDPVTGKVLGTLDPFSAAALNGSPLLEHGAAPNVRRTVQSLTNILTYRISDAFKFTSTSAVRHFYGSELFDPDGFSFPALTAESSGHGSELSQDFRLNYDPGGKFSAFAGVSAFGDSGQQTNALVFDEPLALALVTGQLNRTKPNAGPLSTYTNPALEEVELLGAAGASGFLISPAEAIGIASNLSSSHFEQYLTQSHTEAYDAYVDATYRPIDKLEISGGVRYSEEDKTSKFAGLVGSRSALGGVIGVFQAAASQHFNPFGNGNCTSAAVAAANPFCQALAALAQPSAAGLGGALPLYGVQVQPTVGNGQKVGDSLSDSGLSWRLNARYALTPNVDFYATYARGRRPEVLTAAAPSTPFGPARFTVAPAETLDSYEGGVKTRFFNNRLSLDGAVYYYNYQHFQTTILQGTQFVTADAGNADTYGFEGQASWAITRMADVYATYAFTHGRYENGILDGNQFRLTPEHAVTLGGDYRIAALGGIFNISPNYRWQSKVFFNDDNGNPTIQKDEGALITPLQFDQFQNSYSLVDLRIGYAPEQAHWRVELFATNLTDTKYLKDGGNTGTDIGLPTYIPGEPRFYGVSVTIRR